MAEEIPAGKRPSGEKSVGKRPVTILIDLNSVFWQCLDLLYPLWVGEPPVRGVVEYTQRIPCVAYKATKREDPSACRKRRLREA